MDAAAPACCQHFSLNTAVHCLSRANAPLDVQLIQALMRLGVRPVAQVQDARDDLAREPAPPAASACRETRFQTAPASKRRKRTHRLTALFRVEMVHRKGYSRSNASNLRGLAAARSAPGACSCRPASARGKKKALKPGACSTRTPRGRLPASLRGRRAPGTAPPDDPSSGRRRRTRPPACPTSSPWTTPGRTCSCCSPAWRATQAVGVDGS